MKRKITRFSIRRIRKCLTGLCLALFVIRCVCAKRSENNRVVAQAKHFVDNCLLDVRAITESRIQVTRQGLRQTVHFPFTEKRCSRSLGQVKLLRWEKRHLVCYSNDYARIFQRMESFRGFNLLVCDQDCIHSPRQVFTVAKSRSIESPENQTVTLLPLNVGRHFKHVPMALRDRLSYEEKLPVAVWRGSTTGACWELSANEKVDATRKECARRNLATVWSGKQSDNIDVGLTKLVQLSRELEKKYAPLMKKEISVQDMLRYRYIISVEGNDVATNLKWALASNSVVFMPPPTRESIILESNLRPWIHYVPVLHDFTDLTMKIEYCDNNPLVCQNISLAATSFMLPFATRSYVFILGAQVLEAFVEMMKNIGVL